MYFLNTFYYIFVFLKYFLLGRYIFVFCNPLLIAEVIQFSILYAVPIANIGANSQLYCHNFPSIFRFKDNSAGEVRVYGGKLQTPTPYSIVPVNDDTSIADLIREGLKRFGFEDRSPEDYRLSEILLDRGGKIQWPTRKITKQKFGSQSKFTFFSNLQLLLWL